jgi:hypothetical protein
LAATSAQASSLPGATAEPSATSTITPLPSPTATPATLNPLTGLPVSDPSLIERRPLAIKVSSYPRTARPQAGLSYADMLIEFYQEYGMTRWHALYLSQDVSTVGPIRSGRKIDARLEQMYQSYLIFCAAWEGTWSFFEIQDILPYAMYYGPLGPPAMWRDESQAPINGIYGNTAEIRKMAAWLATTGKWAPDTDPDLTGMVFSDQTPPMKQDATTLRVRFLSNNAIAQWDYNPADGKYYRSSETDEQDGSVTPQVDRLTGEQLSVSNLILVYVDYYRRQGSEIYELSLFGGGKALYFRDGKMSSGTWRVPNVNRPLQFFDQDGPYYQKPGVTWIGMVEDDSMETYEGNTVNVEFAQPTNNGG